MTDQERDDARLSRRSLIKRSAIVGGAAVWAAPVVQSFTSPAGAQATTRVTGSPPCTCCIAVNVEDANGTVVQAFFIDITQEQCDCLCVGGGQTCLPTPLPAPRFCGPNEKADSISCTCVPA